MAHRARAAAPVEFACLSQVAQPLPLESDLHVRLAALLHRSHRRHRTIKPQLATANAAGSGERGGRSGAALRSSRLSLLEIGDRCTVALWVCCNPLGAMLPALPSRPFLSLLFPEPAGDLIDLQLLQQQLERAGQLRYARLRLPWVRGDDSSGAPQLAVVQGSSGSWIASLVPEGAGHPVVLQHAVTGRDPQGWRLPRTTPAPPPGSVPLPDGIVAAWQLGNCAFVATVTGEGGNAGTHMYEKQIFPASRGLQGRLSRHWPAQIGERHQEMAGLVQLAVHASRQEHPTASACFDCTLRCTWWLCISRVSPPNALAGPQPSLTPGPCVVAVDDAIETAWLLNGGRMQTVNATLRAGLGEPPVEWNWPGGDAGQPVAAVIHGRQVSSGACKSNRCG